MALMDVKVSPDIKTTFPGIDPTLLLDRVIIAFYFVLTSLIACPCVPENVSIIGTNSSMRDRRNVTVSRELTQSP